MINALTDADVFVEDRLFATLDTRTRKWQLGGGAEVLLSDTVGFVRNLPHQLVASFKATLEEAVNADLLLHVVDVSTYDALQQIKAVESVLDEIGCGDKPALLVLNKVDIINQLSTLEMLQTVYSEAIAVSARTGYDLEQLAQAVLDKYRGGWLVVRVLSSQSNGKVQSFLRAHATVIDEQYLDGSVTIEARLGRNQFGTGCDRRES